MTTSRTPCSRRLSSVFFAALSVVAGSGSSFAADPSVVRFGPHLDAFATADFTGGGGAQTLSAVNVFASESGGLFLYGRLAEAALGRASWVRSADAATATRIDLRGAEFSPASGPSSTITGLVGTHFLYGSSTPTGGGAAAWMASAAIGASTRIGLWDTAGANLYTSSTGAQTSTVNHVTVTGHLAGVSTLYQGGSASTGQAAWLASTTSGATTRIGFHGTAEFTGSAGQQSSTVTRLADTGWAGGYSLRYNGGDAQLGQAAWVTDGATIHRVGLLSGDAAGGATYVSTGGAAHSVLNGFNATHAAGDSYLYAGDTPVGQAAWFATMPDGAPTRIGLWDETGLGTNEFTSSNGVQLSGAFSPERVGGVVYVRGVSRRYLGTAETNASFGSAYGAAAWIYNVATGETVRMGFVGDAFTKSSGETDSAGQIGAQSSSVSAITASGYILGTSTNYSPVTTGTGQALWVSRVDAPEAITRVGLHDPADTPEEALEFTWANRTQSAFASLGLTESAYLAGVTRRMIYSDDWGVGTTAGQAAWVASAATGETHRVGFTEGFEYASNASPYNARSSNLYLITGASELLNEKARVVGSSERYADQAGANPGAAVITLGQAVWIADADTGTTTRIGRWDAPVYSQQAVKPSGTSGTNVGTQQSVVTGIHAGTEYVWGYSQRYTATATSNVSTNRTAWIYHVATGAQTDLELAQSDMSGLGFSVVTGMTSGGIAYGHHATYVAGSDTSAGNRAFLWSETLGTRTLDSVAGAARLADHGWAYLSSVTAAEDSGAGLLTLVGLATLTGGGTEAYHLTLDLDAGSGPGDGELTAFFDWLTAQGLPADIASHTADPDGDGVPALLEFALGDANANTAATTGIQAIVVDVAAVLYPGVRYTRRREIGGVTLTVEHAGGDLVFPSATALHPHATRDLGGGVDEVEIRSATPLTAGPRQFFRLRAALPE